MQRTRGFTLLELLVALSISTMLVVAVVDLVRLILADSVQQPLALGAIDDARSVSSAFTNEVRAAAFGSDGSYPLAEASTTEIIFFSPYGGSGSVSRIRYFLASGTLEKGVTAPSASGTYDLAQEEVSPVLFGIATTAPLFTYYDGTYDGSSTPLAQPVSVTDVTYVQISLTVLEQEQRASTAAFTTTAGSTMRNLKTNLGD